jgi:predicted Ser/Thr protein kinase
MVREVNMKVNALSEAQYDFLTRYFDLLATVEEGFHFVHERYMEENFGQGDQLLSDIIGAFVQFSSSNVTMDSIFSEDEEVIKQLDQFQVIVDQVARLEDFFNQERDKRVQFVSDTLIPAYLSWKERVEITLEKYHKQ